VCGITVLVWDHRCCVGWPLLCGVAVVVWGGSCWHTDYDPADVPNSEFSTEEKPGTVGNGRRTWLKSWSTKIDIRTARAGSPVLSVITPLGLLGFNSPNIAQRHALP